MTTTESTVTQQAMARVVITRPFMDISWGLYALVYMSVCCISDATDAEILEVCTRENPAGTTNGWCDVVRDHKENRKLNPVSCKDYPGRIHVLIGC